MTDIRRQRITFLTPYQYNPVMDYSTGFVTSPFIFRIKSTVETEAFMRIFDMRGPTRGITNSRHIICKLIYGP
jgi:hypothetical protein